MVKTKKHMTSVEGLIKSNDRLRLLYQESCRRSELNQAVAQHLPDSLKEHVFPVMQDGELFLFVANNAVAQIVRFHSKQLQHCTQASKVTVRIETSMTLPPEPATPRIERKLSAASASVIKEAAGLIKDDALRQALLRLAALGDKTT